MPEQSAPPKFVFTRQQIVRNRIIGLILLVLLVAIIIYNHPWFVMTVLGLFFVTALWALYSAWRRSHDTKFLHGIGWTILLFGVLFTLVYFEEYKHANLAVYSMPISIIASLMVLISARFKRRGTAPRP